MYNICEFLAFYSHFWVFPVTWGHVTSFSVTWRPPSASDRLVGGEMYRIREFFGLLQPLPVDFQENYVTSGSHLVIWGHVTSFPVTWLPPPASYILVGSELYSIRYFLAFYNHFQVTSGQMTSLSVTSNHPSSHDVISCHVTASFMELQPCR